MVVAAILADLQGIATAEALRARYCAQDGDEVRALAARYGIDRERWAHLRRVEDVACAGWSSGTASGSTCATPSGCGCHPPSSTTRPRAAQGWIRMPMAEMRDGRRREFGASARSARPSDPDTWLRTPYGGDKGADVGHGLGAVGDRRVLTGFAARPVPVRPSRAARARSTLCLEGRALAVHRVCACTVTNLSAALAAPNRPPHATRCCPGCCQRCCQSAQPSRADVPGRQSGTPNAFTRREPYRCRCDRGQDRGFEWRRVILSTHHRGRWHGIVV